MDVGKGCVISDKWIPKGLDTNLSDINGNALKTSDKVHLNGCTSKYAIIGKGMNDKYMLYFGSEHGSVGWYLTEETIIKHKVKLV
ncbi:hypothetical protein [Paenibacillus naphthalenovorans]|uniref:Uncharacterized protein n=1 Tax=Paenibacillus naphthalenovorans TaxID=162209 RepID=A0A0U2VFC9_9BACL|nr:hypothetical protein [Paenibacillus naphthalenovorans]ALS22227.1 hypothetical protein IJ22_18530 [Paenibacillus naphthalenovorans]